MTRVTRMAGIALVLAMIPAVALATVTFESRWHWFRQDVGRSVALTADGGYLVCGETWVDTTEYGIVLARTDSLGDTTSVRHLLGVAHGSGYVCALRGGDFVAAGIRNGSHFFAQGFDPSGDSIWTYDSPYRGLTYALIATSDGGCLIAGRDSMLDMGLVRLDSAGNEEWTHSYDEPRVQSSTVNGVAETRDGGFILCGDAIDYMGSYVRLVRTNSAGDTLWTRLLAGPVGPSLQAVCETPDRGFLAVGSEFDTQYSRDVVYLRRADSAGATTWTRDISPADTNAGSVAKALCTARDTGYAIAGTIDWGDSARVWLVKLNSNFDTVWTSVLPGKGREQATAVGQTADGGFVLAGTSDPPNDSILLFKTDSVGHIEVGITEERPTPYERVALSVEPNPASGVARVKWSLPSGSVAKLSLYNALGRQVFSAHGLRTSLFEIRASSFPQGVYLMRLESDRGSATKKLVTE
jgi:hypothetical protein